MDINKFMDYEKKHNDKIETKIMTQEEIAEAAKAYAPNSLALKIPTTIRDYQKRDIEAAFIAGAKWVIKKLSEHSQN